jgi:hypothetical protein
LLDSPLPPCQPLQNSTSRRAKRARARAYLTAETLQPTRGILIA